MPTPLLPAPTNPRILQQRFGQFFGPQTLLSNLTMGNNSAVVLTNGAQTLTVGSQGVTGTNVILGTVGAVTGGLPIVMGSTGYATTTNESYIQWGSTVVTLGGSPLQANISFPASFPTACEGVIVTNGDTSAQTTFVPGVHNPSTSGFTVVTLTAASASGARVNWIAFGH